MMLSPTSHTGDEHDTESNTEHTQFRQLSSVQGRWLSPDPAGMAAADPANPQSFNMYGYVLNNPLSFTDRSGLCPWFDYEWSDSNGYHIHSDSGPCPIEFPFIATGVPVNVFCMVTGSCSPYFPPSGNSGGGGSGPPASQPAQQPNL